MPFLQVDDGKVRVRGQGVGGIGVAAVVPLDVPETGLLVGAGDEADVFGQGELQVPDGLHGQQGGHHGALVVCGAPGRRAGRPPPWAGRGVTVHPSPGVYNVQVAQDVQGGVRLVVQVHGAHIAGEVLPGRPHSWARERKASKAAAGPGPKGLAGLGGAQGTVNPHQAGDGLHQQVLLLGEITFDGRLMEHVRHPPFPACLALTSSRYL